MSRRGWPREQAQSGLRQLGRARLCDVRSRSPAFLDVPQHDSDERSVWFREGEQHLTLGAERYARRAGRRLAKITHGLAPPEMKFQKRVHHGLAACNQ